MLLRQRACRPEYAQAGASLEKNIDDHQVSLMLWLRQPLHRCQFIVRRAHHLDRCELFQRFDQAFTDDRIVFDKIGLEMMHGP